MLNGRRRNTLSRTVVFLVLSRGICEAQTARIGAAIQGTVVDDTGAFVPDCEVTLDSAERGQVRSATTDSDGFFRLGELRVGMYNLRVDKVGFASYLQRGIRLSVGQTVELSVRLSPATVKSQITVSTQPPSIDVSETGVTSVIDSERIEELPVRTRNSLDFVLLAPGVAASNSQALAGGQGALAASGFTFGGLRARSNSISIDGLDNNDDYVGASRTELSPEIVHEFQVVNNGLSAEYGGAAGGSINVITKSGANQMHGDTFIFIQNGALNARDPIGNESSKPSLERYRAGASNGGALVKNQTFYYWAFEQEHKRAQEVSDISPNVATALNAFLEAGAFRGLGTRHVVAGFFPVAHAETEASARMDHQITSQHSLMLRYALTNNREASDAFNTAGLDDASTRGSSFTKDDGLAGSLVSLFSPTNLNDLRFQVAERRVTLQTNDQRGPEIDINGIINFGRPYLGNDYRHEDYYEVSDTLALSQGRHLIKTGIAMNRVHVRAIAPDGFGGVYTFPSLTEFLQGKADSVRQAFGDANTRFAVSGLGAFTQDRWRLNRRLTADLGGRYDFENLPQGFNKDTTNFSPRIGLAYSPSGRWVLRAGFGIFYDRYVLANLNRAIEKDGTQAFEQVVDSGAAEVFQQTAGGPLATPTPGLAPSIFRADPHLATSYGQQSSFGIERQLSTNFTLRGTYQMVRGVRLSRTRNINLLPPVILSGQNAVLLGVPNPTPQQLGRDFFGRNRLDPQFNDVEHIENSASSTYHGLSVSLNRRLADEIEFSASYMVSRTIDDASDFNEQPQNPFNLQAEQGPSLNDQEQRFVMSGLFDLPFGEEQHNKGAGVGPRDSRSRVLSKVLAHIELALIITEESGRPVNPLVGFDSNRSHTFPLSVRPLGFGRNSLRTPAFGTVDFRVLKYFLVGKRARLDLVAESFNLLNHTNVREINPFYGSHLNPMPGFESPAASFPARQVQFSIDFEY